MYTKLWITAAGLAVSSIAFAQETILPAQESKEASTSQGEVDPAAKEFIAKFRAAIKEVKDISCTVEQTQTVDGKKEVFKGEVVATIIRAPGASGVGMLKNFRITSKGEKGDTAWAFDGKNVTRLEHEVKTFASVAAPDGQAFPVMGANSVFPTWTLRDVLSSPQAKVTAAKMLPDAKVGDVACKVVQYTVEMPMPAQDPDEKAGTMKLVQTRHVGAEDLLPRKIESTMTYEGGPMAGGSPREFTGVYTNVKANTKPEKGVFALAAVPGYKTVEAEPQDVGIPSNEAPKLKFAAGEAAPDFVLKSPDGKEVSLASLKGKVVLLDFWATWCGPCKAAMPSIQKLHEKYEGRAVAILGVNTWEQGPANVAQKYMEKNKFTYGLLLQGDGLATAYGISGIPTLVLIGPDGKIIHIGVGFGPGEEEHLSELIAKALGSS
jgi:thiol-disulfide isomerase/thioredoxin